MHSLIGKEIFVGVTCQFVKHGPYALLALYTVHQSPVPVQTRVGRDLGRQGNAILIRIGIAGRMAIVAYMDRTGHIGKCVQGFAQGPPGMRHEFLSRGFVFFTHGCNKAVFAIHPGVFLRKRIHSGRALCDLSMIFQGPFYEINFRIGNTQSQRNVSKVFFTAIQALGIIKMPQGHQGLRLIR